MKTITKTSIIAFTLMVIFTSCGSKSSSSSSNETGNTLSGKWVITKAEGMMAESNVGTAYIFNSGELTFSKDGFDNKAKSTQTDSTFTWENGSMTMEYTYSFSGNQLVVKPKGSDQVLYLERK